MSGRVVSARAVVEGDYLTAERDTVTEVLETRRYVFLALRGGANLVLHPHEGVAVA